MSNTIANTKCYACDARATGLRVFSKEEGKPAVLACTRHANVKVPGPAKPKRQRRAVSRSAVPASWLAAD